MSYSLQLHSCNEKQACNELLEIPGSAKIVIEQGKTDLKEKRRMAKRRFCDTAHLVRRECLLRMINLCKQSPFVPARPRQDRNFGKIIAGKTAKGRKTNGK